MKYLAVLVVIVLVLAPLGSIFWLRPHEEDDPALSAIFENHPATPQRFPWTTSRISGSPELPPAYRTVPAFPHLKFDKPVILTHAPGTPRLFVAEQHGRIFSFPNDPACSQPDLFIDLKKDLQSIKPDGPASGVRDCYGLAFHPDFEKNRYCYICYVLNAKARGKELPDGTRVSRFTVTNTDPPRVEPASEKIIITWLAGGHNGGCLKFGKDGYLYISTGDATPPNPPDALDVGQDMTSLLSSILRIDVDHPEGDQPYSIPADNPFVSMPGVRGEKWAYGFRNPWKISIDRLTGDLWVGDVGWELWEMVYRIEKGGNYGWSVMEGPQQVRPEAKRGPTPILPPTISLPHSMAASVTGGYVYRGKRLKGLYGAYVFGDWETRRMWAARWDGSKIASMDEIIEPAVRIVAFGEDAEGELYIVDHDDGTISQLAENATKPANHAFPRQLSDTGLFQSVTQHRLAAGVMPFVINAEMWADHATAERFIALPGVSTVLVNDRPKPVPGSMFNRLLEFPTDTVLVKTLSLEMERGNPTSRRRIETQVLHYTGKTWNGYSYQWNDSQTDAALVPADGAERTFSVADTTAPGGHHHQTWTFQGRAQCARCHNPWPQHTLAFNLPQLNRDVVEGSFYGNQLELLRSLKILADAPKDPKRKEKPGSTPAAVPRLTNPYDEKADLNLRARSYLQVNCAHCHQMGAGGSAEIDFRFDLAMDKTKSLRVRPIQGTFEIADPLILAPGDPYRSVLFYRISKLGRGRMPMIGSELLDERGQKLIHDWIYHLAIPQDHLASIDQLRNQKVPAKRAEIIGRLLKNTSTALLLARTIQQNGLEEPARSEVIAAAMARPEVQVRDLFETFVPDDQRVRRLGNQFPPAAVLALTGDPMRGRELFFNNATMQCKSCHRIQGTGSTLGPDLSEIGKKYTGAQLLESLVDPSRLIDPKYASTLVALRDGRVVTGVLTEKTDTEIVLRDVRDLEHRIARKDIEEMMVQKTSLMPEGLLRDLTAQQAADLLEYLKSLR